LELERAVLEERLKSFLREDLGYGDITTDSLVDPTVEGIATIVCNEPGVIAGLKESLALLEISGCSGTSNMKDGDHVTAGSEIIKAIGPANSLLKVERTALNLLCHMSGVATITSELVKLAAKKQGRPVRIACTRKTLPGLRYFEKKAVAIGGGDTHRLRLDDAVLIKDNHLAIAGGVSECIKKARAQVSFTKKIEVEATTSKEAIETAKAGADIVLLDNMKPDDIKRTEAELVKMGLREKIILEASGGIQRENIAAYLTSGVDVISMGMITHSARSIDMSMNIRSRTGRRT